MTTTVRRFMILSSARSGSNLLLSLLSGHPAIKTYGELFNLGVLPPGDLGQALDDPIAYLRGRVYKPQRSGVTAAGFKMFYDHLTDDYFRKMVDPAGAAPELRRDFERLSAFISTHYEWPVLAERFRSAWRFLIEDRTLAVVHLKRHNMLDSLISLKTAFATREWWTLKDGGGQAPALQLDPAECRRYFQTLGGFVGDAERAFADHPMLDVSYERLVEHRAETLAELFAFLGVPYRDVTTRMKKQRKAPTSESVSNYAQLREAFRDTEWDGFFR